MGNTNYLLTYLTNYLSVHGLNTCSKTVELVARAVAAFELKMNIIALSEEQNLKLESDLWSVQGTFQRN